MKYGGTERIVSLLNQTYHELGHDSYVAAPGDANLHGQGTHVQTIRHSLHNADPGTLENEIRRAEELYSEHFGKSLEYAKNLGVDILHDHPGLFIGSSEEFFKRYTQLDFPLVTTLHNNVQEHERPKYERIAALQDAGVELHFVAISDSHKKHYEANTDITIDTYIHNGIAIEHLPFQEEKQDYLFWIGRICSDKGTDRAIKIAQETGKPLVIAGPVHGDNRPFYETEVEPHITRYLSGTETEQKEQMDTLMQQLAQGEEIAKPGEIVYIGSVDDFQKGMLYKNAESVLVPNRWDEPFGLVMAEGMATGTPVIGTDTGSIPELIQNGITGYVISGGKGTDDPSIEESIISNMSYATLNAPDLNPHRIREYAQTHFSKETMAQNYLSYYKELLENRTPSYRKAQ